MTNLITMLKGLASPPVQTLRTLQPTPSTITYTVSTRPLASTLPAKFAFYIGMSVRVVLGLVAALALWLKWRVSAGKRIWVDLILGEAGAGLVKSIDETPGLYLVPAVLMVLYLVVKRSYTEESLTVLRGLGLQTSTTSSVYLRTPNTRFIPTTGIQDIFIHEAFKGFEVRFYLAIVVKGEQNVVVGFPRLRPRLAILEEVWRGSRGCLFGVEMKVKEEEA